MTYSKKLAVAVAVVGAMGCSSGRDVEVTGSVTAPSSVTVGDQLMVDFIDVVGDGSDTKQTLVSSAELQAPGAFEQTVPLEGDQVLIRAIDDRNGDGKCTPGEAWGEVHAPVTADKAQAAVLILEADSCP